MASHMLQPNDRPSTRSSDGYESDDSMASIKNKEDEEKREGWISERTSTLRRSAQRMTSQGSDNLSIFKKGFGMGTETLCTACKKIPFEACLPNESTEPAETATGEPEALVFYKSLSDILKWRKFCKFCELLYRSICEPEYDLLKAEHIREHLPDSEKFRNMKGFSEWIKENTYWKREWVGGAGLWPFGYAVDRRQHASSTVEKAQTLFLEAEDRDIRAKSLNLNELKDLYSTNNSVADTVNAAQTSLTIINLATKNKTEGMQKGLASAQFAMGQLALLQNKKRKRLPCILMLRAYRKDEKKKGALSVRVYGHGRAPLAPLKEICHFSLRFEDSDIPRVKKQQIWYGRPLGPQIDVPFFKHCVDTCTARHNCGQVLSTPSPIPAWYEAAAFRLIDVNRMCIVTKDFADIIRPQASKDVVRYVALSYRWGILGLMKGWKETMTDGPQGKPYYYNVDTQETTWTRPDATRVTSENEHALSFDGSLESDSVYIPKTIKDAIEVVQRMDEQFLWVDQLCILQEGNEEDKHSNIKRMDHIYSHALFTIVAGDSLHADEGLKGLHSRSNHHQIMEDGIIKNTRMVLPARMNMDFERWEERAWTLQEKLLTTRILISADGFAVWHCRGGVWREDVNALDGDKALVSFPWLQLTPCRPADRHELTQAGLTVRREDESVRLRRLPAMHQYIEAVEDLGKRTIGKTWDILSAFEGVVNILASPSFFNSPFRKGLPNHFLDVALLWQSDEPIRRRKHASEQCPPSWTWAGWEAGKKPLASGHQGALVRYDKPYDLLFLDAVVVQRYCKLGEERIRPRKGTFYGVQQIRNGYSLQELGLFSMPHMAGKGFKDWGSVENRPAPKPRLSYPLDKLDDQYLIVHTEIAGLEVGEDCWRVRTTTQNTGSEHCIVTLSDTRHMTTQTLGLNEQTPAVGEPEVIVTQEHWINTTTLEKVGTMKFDAGYGSQTTTIVLAIVLSEAQFLGNETSPDVLGYPLYNIMLIEKVREDHGMLFAERIGLGKIYKHAWRDATSNSPVASKGDMAPKRELVILE